MADHRRLADVLVGLVFGDPITPTDLADLPASWLEFVHAIQAAPSPSARVAAFESSLRALPSGAPIRARLQSALDARTRPPVTPLGLVNLGDVVAHPVRWLWPRRLPLGKLTILDGDPGLGKSALTLDLGARVSSGQPMPDGAAADLAGPAGVVLLAAEDALADTVRPRLEAAGADLARVVALTLVPDRAPAGRRPASDPPFARLPTLADLAALRHAIAAVRAALVVVDPIMAYLPREVNSSRDTDVRAVLVRLANLAETEGVAVLAVRHLTKAGRRNPLYRGTGSIGIIGSARSGLLVAKDPADESGARRVLAGTKSNLAAPLPALAFHLAAPNGALRVIWEGPTDHTADSLLDAQHERDAAPSTALAEARDLLTTILATGPRPATDVQAEARAAGITPSALRRARAALAIRARKSGYQGRWLWYLPTAPADDEPATSVKTDQPHPNPQR